MSLLALTISMGLLFDIRECAVITCLSPGFFQLAPPHLLSPEQAAAL